MLAVYLFLVVLAAQTVAWVGQGKLSQLAFQAYASLVKPSSWKEQARLRRQILKTKSDLQATSSQDEFAKWARLRRKLDKEVAELDKASAQSSATRTQFVAVFTSLLWALTTGLQILIVYWHRATPVYYLPPRWFPALVSWGLSFPSAPSGAISAAVWAMACRRSLGVLARAVSSMQPTPTPTPVPGATSG